jgi:hypothetical protein
MVFVALLAVIVGVASLVLPLMALVSLLDGTSVGRSQTALLGREVGWIAVRVTPGRLAQRDSLHPGELAP